MSKTISKSFDDHLLEGLEEWRKQNPEATRWDNDSVVQWLMDNENFGLEKRIVRKELAKKLAKALNRKRMRNKQGNRVRVYHAAKLPTLGKGGKWVQKTFWAHRLKLDASFAHKSMEQRQKQAEGFCRSMYKDAQDLNDNNTNLVGNQIQLEFDFTYVTGAAPRQEVQILPTELPHDSERLAKKKPR